jgi:hypothetical protein
MRDESRKALRTIGRSGGPFRLSAVQRCSRSRGADNLPSPVHKLLRDANLPELHLFQSLGEARGADTPHVSIQRKAAMRAHRMFLSLAIAIGCGITLQSAAISQEYRGTWQQQQGLHARRLEAVRWADPRCEQDRGLLTAKYSATQRSVPRGLRSKRHSTPAW